MSTLDSCVKNSQVKRKMNGQFIVVGRTHKLIKYERENQIEHT